MDCLIDPAASIVKSSTPGCYPCATRSRPYMFCGPLVYSVVHRYGKRGEGKGANPSTAGETIFEGYLVFKENTPDPPSLKLCEHSKEGKSNPNYRLVTEQEDWSFVGVIRKDLLEWLKARLSLGGPLD